MNDEDKKKINFDELIEAFNKWKEMFDKDPESMDKEWMHWMIDANDAIIDIYNYLKLMGVLFTGLSKLLYDPKEEVITTNLINEEEIKKIYT